MNLSLDLEDVKIDNKRDVYLFGGLFLIILNCIIKSDKYINKKRHL